MTLNMTTLDRTDAHGNPVSGPSEAVAGYDAAVDRLLRYHPDVLTETASLVALAPGFPMGHVFAGYLALTSTDTPDLASARDSLGRLEGLALNDREAAHRSALGAWAGGDWHGAARRLDDLLVTWPADLLALLVGHQLDFFVGDAQNLRDRIGRSLASVDPSHPHLGFVRGMYAFGLEESGHYEDAEAQGLTALATNPDDVWAVHAVVHTYEMRGRVEQGIAFMREREPDWSRDNLFTVHNWWHLGLFLLETERHAEVLTIYDAGIHNPRSDGVPLEMLDASSLLWRLLLDGADTGERFAALADAWATRSEATPWYVFNDLHAVMAFAGAGRVDDARAVIARLVRYVSDVEAHPGSNVAMAAEIGLPACRAVLAHVEGRHDDVLAELVPIRSMLQRFGGSHAQRDVLQRTIVVSAIRSGRLDLAHALTRERLAVRETSVWSRRQLATLLRLADDTATADGIASAADADRDRFAAAR